MFNHATSLHDMNAPFAYAITMPNDARVGAVEINDPLRSGLATSVMYTMAGPVKQMDKMLKIGKTWWDRSCTTSCYFSSSVQNLLELW